MKTSHRSPDFGSSHPTRSRPAPHPARFGRLNLAWLPTFLALTALLLVVGCSFLKPTQDRVRHFVLAPVLPVKQDPIPNPATALGIGQVRIPAYLNRTALAVRVDANEVEYLSEALWAERLDQALQRALAANLAATLPTDQVRLSAWHPEDITLEVHVTVERFDVTANGEATLKAWWRLLTPGGERLLKSGLSSLTLPGPPPMSDPAGAVRSLSELLGAFSRELAQAVRSVE